MIFAAMSDGVTIAIVVAIGTLATVSSPLVLASMTNRASRQSKQQDWDRQDEVAARALAATQEVAKSQAALLSAAAVTVQRLTAVEEQGHLIHHLVNSAYTASLEATRVALVGQRDALFRASGPTAPNNEDAEAIGRLDTQISALEETIADRLRAQKTAEAEIAETQTAAKAPEFSVAVPVDVPVYSSADETVDDETDPPG
jgi:hypothetical protein